MSVEFVSGKEHYDNVIERVASVKKSLWIGTADIKDLHVKDGTRTKPFLGVLADLLKRGVEIRLIHAKEPVGIPRRFRPLPNFKDRAGEDALSEGSLQDAYIRLRDRLYWPANLTGAGIGMKSSNRRNFEAGILTDEAPLIDAACEQFDSVWRGEHCTRCGRRQYCTDPIK